MLRLGLESALLREKRFFLKTEIERPTTRTSLALLLRHFPYQTLAETARRCCVLLLNLWETMT